MGIFFEFCQGIWAWAWSLEHGAWSMEHGGWSKVAVSS